MRRTVLVLAVAALALAGSASAATSQENYPTKPIRLIVPEVVGSAADLMSRIIGKQLSEALGQPVTFENQFLEAGVEMGIKAPPDGYTLIYGSSGNLALHVLEIMEAILRSGETKSSVAITGDVVQPALLTEDEASSLLA